MLSGKILFQNFNFINNKLGITIASTVSTEIATQIQAKLQCSILP